MLTISSAARIADLRIDRDRAMLAARVARALEEPEMVKDQIGEARFLNNVMVRAKRLESLRGTRRHLRAVA